MTHGENSLSLLRLVEAQSSCILVVIVLVVDSLAWGLPSVIQAYLKNYNMALETSLGMINQNFWKTAR